MKNNRLPQTVLPHRCAGRSLFIALLLLVGIQLPTRATGELTDSITHRFRQQLLLFPQEKAYLHTDRSRYSAGDTVWMRAHLLDAATHQAVTASRYVYVELIDAESKLMKRIKLRPVKEVYQGYIPLDPLLPQGYYTLRAYTRLMESMPENYFFHSTIAVTNPMGGKKEEQTSGTAATQSVYQPPFDVGFFPEGGYLPAGVPWRVAFKGVDREGWSEAVYGQVIERESGDTVATLQHMHRGMGLFRMTAEKGKQYVAQVFNHANRYLEFELPEAVESVPMLSVHWVKNRLGVTLSHPQCEGLRLVMHTRGVVFYSRPWNPQQPTLFVAKEQLPVGVIQLLLVDAQERVLSERLVFNHSPQALQTSLTADKPTYGRREAVAMSALLNTQGSDSTEMGNFSVAVSLNEDAEATSTADIYTYLLLSSELKGTVELPETYFNASDKQAEQHLDLLMLTQGWRRYNIEQVAQGEFRRPRTRPEVGQEIHGQVVSEYNGRPRPDAPVLMIISGLRFYEEKVSDSLGRFSFTHLEFPDSTKYIVSGLTRKGKSHDVQVNIREELFPEIPDYASVGALLNRAEVKNELNINALPDSTIRLIELQQVEITASFKRPRTPIGFMPNANTTTFDGNYYQKKSVYDMYDLLNSTPYVTCYDNTVLVRASPGNSRGSNMRTVQLPALILVDNMEVTTDQLLSLDAMDVEEVSVVRKVTNSAFDMRGYGALLLVYTSPNSKRKSRFSKMNIAGYMPLGYQRPVAFYAPKYVSRVKSSRDNRRTLYWSPCVRIGQTGKADFSFYTGDKPGLYTATVQGVTRDGQIIHAQQQFVVE